MMEELHTIVSLGGGGVTKLVDRATGYIERLANAKYPQDTPRRSTPSAPRRSGWPVLRRRPSKGGIAMPYQLRRSTTASSSDPTDFLARVRRELPAARLAAVDKILAQMKESPIVLLSGPSGSGKTTTAMKIAEELERRGVNTHAVAMDNYFKTLNRRTAPAPRRGTSTTRSPALLDMELLDRHFAAGCPGGGGRHPQV